MTGLILHTLVLAQDTSVARPQGSSGHRNQPGDSTMTTRNKHPGKNKDRYERGSRWCRFVDKDGDGYNDRAPDHDGDGIPNGLDPDWKGRRFRGGSKGYRSRFKHTREDSLYDPIPGQADSLKQFNNR